MNIVNGVMKHPIYAKNVGIIYFYTTVRAWRNVQMGIMKKSRHGIEPGIVWLAIYVINHIKMLLLLDGVQTHI